MFKLKFLFLAGIVCVLGVGLAWDDAKLPPPFATPSVNNGPRVIARPGGGQLRLPKGFEIEEFATDFQLPRYMLLGPSYEILVTDSTNDGTGYVLTNQGKTRKKLIGGLDRPYGLAFWNDYLYVGETTSVKRYKYDSKAMTAGKGEEIVSLKGFGKGPWPRSLLFDRAGKKLYAGVA